MNARGRRCVRTSAPGYHAAAEAHSAPYVISNLHSYVPSARNVSKWAGRACPQESAADTHRNGPRYSSARTTRCCTFPCQDWSNSFGGHADIFFHAAPLLTISRAKSANITPRVTPVSANNALGGNGSKSPCPIETGLSGKTSMRFHGCRAVGMDSTLSKADEGAFPRPLPDTSGQLSAIPHWRRGSFRSHAGPLRTTRGEISPISLRGSRIRPPIRGRQFLLIASHRIYCDMDRLVSQLGPTQSR